MNRKHIFLFLIGLIATLILETKFNLIATSSSLAQGDTKILVSAAASLQDALKEIKPIFQQTQKNITVNYNFGSSGALQQQIEQGAPVDIFFSASLKQVNALEAKNLLIPATRKNLLTNSLVLIVPKNSQLNIKDFSQLTDPKVKRIAVGDFKSVPVGQYTEEVFKNLKILEKIKSKLILGNNVRNVLAAVESGNADAGVVYMTDTKISNNVKIAALASPKLHSPIIYPIAVTKSSKNLQAAQEFIRFLSQDLATNIFKKYGFQMAK